MNRLSLGTAQFGSAYGIANRTGQVERTAVRAMLQLAASRGVDTLDTAIAYGESEACLGEAGTQGFRVVTKLPAVPPDCTDIRNWVGEQLAASFQRLSVQSVYGLLLHRPGQLLEHNGKLLYRVLQDLKEDGLVGKIGISIYAPSELDELTQDHCFDLVQAPLNILDRRLVESGWAERLKSMGVELHTRSAFLQGLLLMPAANRPAKFDRWLPVWREWELWLQEVGISPLAACLRYAFSVTEVDRVVVGIDSLGQLAEILAVTDDPLSSFPRWSGLADINILMNPACWGDL